MNVLTDPSNFTVALALGAHAQAETSRKKHTQPAQAKQAYLNALAVYATHFYLDCMAFDTEQAADNTVQQTLLNTAALTVNMSNTSVSDQLPAQLECRPVLPTDTSLFVPPEVQCDRMGYVAVRLSEDLRQATLLGFVEHVEQDYTPLDQLQPIEALTTKLESLLSSASVPASVTTASAPLTQLSGWINNVAEAGWQTIETLLNTSSAQGQLAWGFRGGAASSDPAVSFDEPAAETAPIEALEDPNRALVQRSKRIQLQQNNETVEIVLQVGFFQQNSDDVEIWVRLRSGDNQGLLPASLQLLVLDQDDAEVMQAEARSTEAIQLKFAGAVGERFSLKVVWQDTYFVESFVI